MAYDHEEQEQLAQLKAWWNDHGNFVLGTVAAVAIALGGWFGWRAWQDDQSAKAGTLYESLTRAVREGDLKALREAGGALAETFPKSLYASMGALVSARVHFERGDAKNAKAQLQWVLERSPSEELRDVARLRLAAVLLDEKAYDEALKWLEAKHAEAFVAQYAALKGDVLTARNQAAEAKAAYRLALEKADRKNESFRASVQMRLDALGG